MKPDVQQKWQKARELVRSHWSAQVTPAMPLTHIIQAKNSSGSGVDAANVMLAQLNAQKTVKKKISPAPAPQPGTI